MIKILLKKIYNFYQLIIKTEKNFKLKLNRIKLKLISTQKNNYLEKFNLVNGFIEFQINSKDLIQGDKFVKIANNRNIFFCETHKVNDFFKNNNIKKKYILISHQSDAIVTDNPRNINRVRFDEHANINLMPNNCIKWFAQNVEVLNSKLESIPIGFHNDKDYKENFNKLEKLKKEKRNIKNIVYLNVNIKNNYTERAHLYDLFSKSSYVTKLRGEFGIDFESYIEDVRSHLFMICPEGNGIDVCQPFEAIYLGCIPIMKKNINNLNWRELPICWVDNFDEILDIEYLIKAYDLIKNSNHDLQKFHFNYWQQKILTTQDF
jgi:hypothetical protein